MYLGKTPITSSPVFVLLCTTTTKLHYYERGGERSSHAFVRFRGGEFGFESDCVLDLDGSFYADIKETVFMKYKDQGDIEIKGNLIEQKLREIYNQILSSRMIPKRIKKDIHNSFNMAGITSLKKPR